MTKEVIEKIADNIQDKLDEEVFRLDKKYFGIIEIKHRIIEVLTKELKDLKRV